MSNDRWGGLKIGCTLIAFLVAIPWNATLAQQPPEGNRTETSPRDVAPRPRTIETLDQPDRKRLAQRVDEIANDSERDHAYAQTASEIVPQDPSVSPRAAAGGGAQPDFATLINLIQTTVEPDSWDQNGGIGAIVPFPTGVLIDPRGLLRRDSNVESNPPSTRQRPPLSAPRADTIRMVSLPRLERTLLRHVLAGEPIPPLLLRLGGLTRITSVIADPEHHDLILAGPVDEDQPTLRLDDLLVLFANAQSHQGSFGCAINPRRGNLARTQAFLKKAGPIPFPEGRRATWLESFRNNMGQQDIVVEGIPSTSHVARIIVAADYHMKLIGMGIESGEPFVKSYLASLSEDSETKESPMDVLRWWFVLDYEEIGVSADHKVVRLDGQGARVLSESELIGPGGERLHTGSSLPRNASFAANFSRAFPHLAEKYPIYRHFRAICDLAMACTVIEELGLADSIAWQPKLTRPEFAASLIPEGPEPKEVESVVADCLLSPRRITAGVSGGVEIRATPVLASRRNAISMSLVSKEVRSRLATKRYEQEPRWWWECAMKSFEFGGRLQKAPLTSRSSLP